MLEIAFLLQEEGFKEAEDVPSLASNSGHWIIFAREFQTMHTEQ